ncbi:hypothetical protein B0H67DRAFT_647488 [Lasiosphaeris hirsuta]|uniref:Allergen n=1 Tax=Lasiosphaeris hirsuta TaxID=260670 RepID=A0AA40A0Y3_9PEZI|nr:hypothetical protein B0H67DRAFT_647488 [Lasiosphaeris hirsuta]
MPDPSTPCARQNGAGKDKATRQGFHDASGAPEGPSVSHHEETVDQDTSFAPAVTHETVKPVQHNVVEEQIQRETHVHDVYHRIQPVRDVEVLPARHHVQGADGALTEVHEKDLPSYFGDSQEGIGEASRRSADSQRGSTTHGEPCPPTVVHI